MQDFQTQLQMAAQYRQVGQSDVAEKLVTRVLSADPDNVDALILLGALRGEQQNGELAMELLERAVSIAPDHLLANVRLSEIYGTYGHLEEAKHQYRRIIELDPGNGHAHLEMARLTRYTKETAEITAWEKKYSDAAPGSELRKKLAFALGKVFDDLGNYEKAFSYYAAGNQICRTEYEFSVDERERGIRAVQDLFNADFLRRYAGAGSPDDSPIFITGMPRSGSTLTEQIFASHPDVEGGGESMGMYKVVKQIGSQIGSLFPVGFDRLDASVIRQAADNYCEDLRKNSNGARFVTDKSNNSYITAALITVMLPNAKIIFCSRDFRDQGLSYFQQDLTSAHPYCNNLTEMGRMYRAYQQLMEHWHKLMPGRIFVSSYEELVRHPEENIRKLLAHCDLEFDEACLAFNQTRREVKTVSRAQVRRPMYTDSIGKWKNYEKQLQPLLDVLQTHEL